MKSVLIKNGTLVTMDRDNSVIEGDLLVLDGRIKSVGEKVDSADEVIDALGCAV